MKVVSNLIRTKVEYLLKEAEKYKNSAYLDKTVEILKEEKTFKIITDQTEEEIKMLKASLNYEFVGNIKQLKRLIGSVMQRKTCNLKVAIAIHSVAMEQKTLLETVDLVML